MTEIWSPSDWFSGRKINPDIAFGRTTVWCPDRDTMPIEGVEIAPRPTLQSDPSASPMGTPH